MKSHWEPRAERYVRGDDDRFMKDRYVLVFELESETFKQLHYEAF